MSYGLSAIAEFLGYGVTRAVEVDFKNLGSWVFKNLKISKSPKSSFLVFKNLKTSSKKSEF